MRGIGKAIRFLVFVALLIACSLVSYASLRAAAWIHERAWRILLRV